MPGQRGACSQSFANASKDVFLFAHDFFRVRQYSLNVCAATGGRSRVLVQSRAGSRTDPLTIGCSLLARRPMVFARPYTAGRFTTNANSLKESLSQKEG